MKGGLCKMKDKKYKYVKEDAIDGKDLEIEFESKKQAKEFGFKEKELMKY